MPLHLLFKSLLRRKMVTALLLIQLAMTFALLLNSMLLAQQTRQKLQQPTGLPLQQTLQVQLKPTSIALRQYPALGDLLVRQLEAVRAIPGVVAVAYSNQSPLHEGGSNGNIHDPDREELSKANGVPLYNVSTDFFAVLQLPLLAGELPQSEIAIDGIAPSPVVITQSLANKVFDGEPAIGRQLNRGPVAAVVADFYGQRKRNEIEINFNSVQVAPLWNADWGYVLLIRTTADTVETVRQALPQVLQQVDSNIEIFSVRTLQEQLQRLYSNEFGLASLLSLLSVLMLLVSMISSYSNAYFHTLKHQQEIGIKRALGASKRRIFTELLSENWLSTVLGAIAGVGCAVVLNQLLSQVISIPPLSWWLPLATCAILLLCVTVATWYPAAIATRVSPATATKTL
ncbi:FtsX-like permease family protein [Rheinheimera sp. EpRS3]|jgi:putative ABC transport system permease protein|uniref:FtsX-like permease family protein n=1 Tax=Rheinheimera sp. EpRS3 TaxID=1712383 RepID=UPI0007478DFE|nr:FtsX-like permease family protein [Rheinheimera sp. EpRS3]KUM52780.1 ABC transporter permease [Rheinheimera sp. EpRS3]